MTRAQVLNNSKFFDDVRPASIDVWADRLLIVCDGYQPEVPTLLNLMLRYNVITRTKTYSRLYKLCDEAATLNVASRSMRRNLRKANSWG
jgi:hypothetical protein